MPNLEKLMELQKQLAEIINNYSGEGKTKEDVEKAKHLVAVIKDGVERQAIENYSEKVNVYEMVQTLELKGSLLAAEMVLENH